MLAFACFINMFSVGTMYSLSILHAQLPRLIDASFNIRSGPFGAANVGLMVGCATAAAQIHRHGPASVMGRGTTIWGLCLMVAGFFIRRGSIAGILGSLAVGGVGVGWTYLAVVMVVGQAIPTNAVARSAIGPLGFSTGSAACFVGSRVFHLDTSSQEQLVGALACAGALFAAVGLLTTNLLRGQPMPTPPPTVTESKGKSNLSLLLFMNAFPGMVVFSAFDYADALGSAAYPNEPVLAVAGLAAGGIVGPLVTARFGATSTFSGLFLIRGLLALAWSQTQSSVVGLCGLVSIFFGHGTGFSSLPSLLRSELIDQKSFSWEFGRILVVWGASGVTACVVNEVLLLSRGLPSVALVVSAAAFLSAAAVLRLKEEYKIVQSSP